MIECAKLEHIKDEETNKLRTNSKWKGLFLAFFVVTVFVGLLLRDSYGVDINKYVFLLICSIPILFFDVKYTCLFLSFIFPLYVGLPGNLISIFILIRFLFIAVHDKVSLDANIFVLTVLLSGYILIQNFITGQTSVYCIMGAVDFIILMFFFRYALKEKCVDTVIVFYAIGVFSTVFIMLMTTLNSYTLLDLLNNSTRLGITGLLKDETVSSMVVTIDPNFLGMNAIAAVAAGSVIAGKNKNRKIKICIIALLVAIAVLSMLGLSRAYFLSLILWVVMYLFSQKNAKRACAFLLAVIILYIAFKCFMPDFYDALMERFAGDDIVTGNGRIKLITMYADMWFENIGTFLFGIGLYNCHTHCAPLLYLFGLGILGFAVLVLLELNYIFKVRAGHKVRFKYWIPFFLTLLMSATIPAAGALSYIYPVFLSILTLNAGVNEGTEKYE